MIERQSSCLPVFGSDLERNSVVKTVFDSLFEFNFNKTIAEALTATQSSVQLYLLIRQAFNSLNLGAMRFVPPAVLYPCIQNFSTFATAMIL
jgi:hypothetical protein